MGEKYLLRQKMTFSMINQCQYFNYIFHYIGVTLFHSIPSTSGEGKSGLLFTSRAAFPRMR